MRTRWRLPLDLRELIAAIYQLGGGVYSREILAMNLAGQLSRLPASQNNAKVASSKTARLLKLGLPELNRLREPPAAPAIETVPDAPLTEQATASEPASQPPAVSGEETDTPPTA